MGDAAAKVEQPARARAAPRARAAERAGAGGGAHAADAAFCAQQITQAASDFTRFRTTYTNPSSPPRSAKGGTVRSASGEDWTRAFPRAATGCSTSARATRPGAPPPRASRRALAPLAALTNTHDVGFLIYNSYGNGYRLTQSAAYRTVLLQAAASLASRYDADVGCTRSWDFGSWMFPVIIDNMMNLELLFRATMLGGEARFAQIGTSHAATTSTNHFRADSSSYHVVDYNPTTGAVIRKQTNQGVADESAWARGQAWGLYGFTMSYRETNDARFLDRATRIAEFYTKSPRMPADGVPYFDFDAPVRDDVPDNRDASAGAIAASGLFELAKYATGAAAESYRAFAIKAVRSLSSTAIPRGDRHQQPVPADAQRGQLPAERRDRRRDQLRRLLLSGGPRALRGFCHEHETRNRSRRDRDRAGGRRLRLAGRRGCRRRRRQRRRWWWRWRDGNGWRRGGNGCRRRGGHGRRRGRDGR